jgi:hypothetical protein
MSTILNNLLVIAALFLSPVVWPKTGLSISWQTSGSAALMQQPSSQYYHYCYGGEFELRSNDASHAVKLSYLQRPEFSYGGFSDQEQAFALLYGGSLSSKSFLFKHAAAYLGVSQISGSITEESSATTRTYSSNGLMYAFEWGKLKDRFTASVFHSSHVGFGSGYQSEAFVAWPYIFYGAKIGWAI